MVVGLNTVEQLSLSVHFSGLLGITEGYNLVEVGRIINHLGIPGNKQAGVSNPWTSPLKRQQWSIKPEIVPILDLWISEVWIWGIWRPSRDQSGEGSGRSILGSF